MGLLLAVLRNWDLPGVVYAAVDLLSAARWECSTEASEQACCNMQVITELLAVLEYAACRQGNPYIMTAFNAAAVLAFCAGRPVGRRVLSEQRCFDALVRVVFQQSVNQVNPSYRDTVSVFNPILDMQWPQADDGHSFKQQQQQQQIEHAVLGGPQPLVLQHWHVQLLTKAVRIDVISVLSAVEVLMLLQRISCSAVGNATLLGPVTAALRKKVQLPGRLAQVEWQEAHPQGTFGSALGRMTWPS
jgi:hypothetical protein